MKKPKKNDIITFKIDESLKEFLAQVENRSEFIRKAILDSFEGQCPLCKGSGRLSKEGQEKWYRIKIILDNYFDENGDENGDFKSLREYTDDKFTKSPHAVQKL